ncbi:cytochrome c [Marinoscillum sp. MHG1-6]|uniref:cytochrome c n=1 Tax=Marinoscillum sp. MHG1-6 TaxID=2959627 RepID=UPI0021581C3C|nr:cytochrome c [Marinoscillum sp. MHG1-6]
MKRDFWVLILLLGWLLSSCTYRDDTDVSPEPIDNGGQQISFSTSVQPLFTSNCAVTNCHVSGGESPNLEVGVAYNELFSNSLINVSDPESSEILIRMRSLTDPMPTSGKLSNAQINIVATWISQGAKDN